MWASRELSSGESHCRCPCCLQSPPLTYELTQSHTQRALSALYSEPTLSGGNLSSSAAPFTPPGIQREELQPADTKLLLSWMFWPEDLNICSIYFIYFTEKPTFYFHFFYKETTLNATERDWSVASQRVLTKTSLNIKPYDKKRQSQLWTLSYKWFRLLKIWRFAVFLSKII